MSDITSGVLISLTLIAVVLFSGCIGTGEPEETTSSTLRETSTTISCVPAGCGELCRLECGCMEPTQECMLFANWRCRNPECPTDTDCICDTTTSIDPTPVSLYYKPDKPPSGAYLLKGVTSDRYAAEYQGYQFKVDHFTYCAEHKVCKVPFTIANPDGTEIQRKVGGGECSDFYDDARPHDLVLRLWSVRTSGREEIADIYIWDFSKHPVMESIKREPPHPDAKLLAEITSAGYTSKYEGYAFKVDRLLFTGKYQISGMVLVVRKPSGEEVQVTLTVDKEAKVDNINIRMPCGYAEQIEPIAVGGIYVWES